MFARPCSFRAVLFAALAALAVVGASSCRPAPAPTLRALDQKVHATPLTTFDRWWRGEQAAANHVSRATVDRWLASSPGRLDSAAARARPWDVSTDLCSFAPDTGPVFDFRAPCVRHDFAWRNLRCLDRQAGGGIDTRSRRLAATRQFLVDMQTTCAARPAIQRTACRAVASAYHRAVSAVS